MRNPGKSRDVMGCIHDDISLFRRGFTGFKTHEENASEILTETAKRYFSYNTRI